jgi:hypothetical protein
MLLCGVALKEFFQNNENGSTFRPPVSVYLIFYNFTAIFRILPFSPG